MPHVQGAPDDRFLSSPGSLCDAFVTDLGVSGASIWVVGDGDLQSTVCSSDATVARAEALQFELGEGPHWDALSSRAPVFAPDLDDAAESRWPLLIDGMRGLGLRSAFAFPMLVGAALVGVVDLYSTRARRVDREFAAQASRAARQVAMEAVQQTLRSASDPTSEESPMAPALRREVHQATGMIVSQLGIPATDAFARLQGHSLATGRRMDEVAHKVVRGELAFDDLPDGPTTREEQT